MIVRRTAELPKFPILRLLPNTLDSNSTSPQLAPGRLNAAGHLVLMVPPADIFFSLLKEMLDAAAARQKYY